MVALRREDRNRGHHGASGCKVPVPVLHIRSVVYEVTRVQHEEYILFLGNLVCYQLVPLELAVPGLVLGITVHDESERAALREGPEMEITRYHSIVQYPVMIQNI